VTAEAAVVLPVLVAFALALVWGLLVMSAQIRCVDAARAGARAAARQDPVDAVLAVARATAPRGADVTVGREGDQVRVIVVAKPPVLRGLPFEVREEAVAAAEEAPAASDDLGETRGPSPAAAAGNSGEGTAKAGGGSGAGAAKADVGSGVATAGPGAGSGAAPGEAPGTAADAAGGSGAGAGS
jgi:hypothetical protein